MSGGGGIVRSFAAADAAAGHYLPLVVQSAVTMAAAARCLPASGPVCSQVVPCMARPSVRPQDFMTVAVAAPTGETDVAPAMPPARLV